MFKNVLPLIMLIVSFRFFIFYVDSLEFIPVEKPANETYSSGDRV